MNKRSLYQETGSGDISTFVSKGTWFSSNVVLTFLFVLQTILMLAASIAVLVVAIQASVVARKVEVVVVEQGQRVLTDVLSPAGRQHVQDIVKRVDQTMVEVNPEVVGWLFGNTTELIQNLKTLPVQEVFAATQSLIKDARLAELIEQFFGDAHDLHTLGVWLVQRWKNQTIV